MAVWDDRIELVGWNNPPSAHLGEKFDAVVYYRVLQPVERSWKAFVHIDLDGKNRANADHDPIGGHCPTSTWQVGDILASTERFYPGRLAEFLTAFLAGQVIDEPFERWN